MEVVDRHGWAEGMTVRIQGRDVGFRSDRPGLLERVYDRLPPGWRHSDKLAVRRLYSLRTNSKNGRPARRKVLYMNASRFETSTDLEYLFDRLEADVQLYVAERATRRIFVHAGVVGWEGRAIVLPARSMSGKTTLVEELLKLGATYYSDEYAVFDARGRVHPFPKPLSVRTDEDDSLAVRRFPAEYGAGVGTTPVHVGLVAFTTYEPGVTWRPRAVTEGRAILALLEHTVPARRRPKASFATLQRAISSAEVIRGTRGDARGVAESLLERASI